MVRNVALVLFMAITSTFTAFSTDRSGIDEAKIVRVGCFHSDEVTVATGRNWLALSPSETGFALYDVKATVRPCKDFLVDNAGDSIMSGREVVVSGIESPLILIGGVDGLRPGPIKTVFNGAQILIPGESLLLSLSNSQLYSFEAKAIVDSTRPAYDQLYLQYKVTLRKHMASQKLIQYDRIAPDGMPTLLWAGDLDRDNSLDFLMDITNHYNVSEYALFLSSLSDNGNLVRFSASVRHVGC